LFPSTNLNLVYNTTRICTAPPTALDGGVSHAEKANAKTQHKILS